MTAKSLFLLLTCTVGMQNSMLCMDINKQIPLELARAEIAQNPLALYDAVKDNDLNHVKLLIDAGADLDKQGSYSATPLNLAAILGFKDIAHVLIEHKASRNIFDSAGMGPLHEAATRGRKNIVELFIEHNTPVDIPDSAGRTPLYHAASWGHKDIIKFLIQQGADIDARDTCGQTLFYGISNPAILKFLLFYRPAQVSPLQKLCLKACLKYLASQKLLPKHLEILTNDLKETITLEKEHQKSELASIQRKLTVKDKYNRTPRDTVYYKGYYHGSHNVVAVIDYVLNAKTLDELRHWIAAANHPS